MLVGWPVERNGLLFSVIERNRIIEPYGIEKGQRRQIHVEETILYKYTDHNPGFCSQIFSTIKLKYTVSILAMGSLEHCHEQFSIHGNSAKYNFKFSNDASKKLDQGYWIIIGYYKTNKLHLLVNLLIFFLNKNYYFLWETLLRVFLFYECDFYECKILWVGFYELTLSMNWTGPIHFVCFYF